MSAYVHEKQGWPSFRWDIVALMPVLGSLRGAQGRLMGKMESLGFALQDEASLQTLTQDVIKNSEIEGEHLNLDQVRSSIARHLGMEVAGLIPSSRNVDGVVEMMLDATQRFDEPLTAERMFGWHAALFASGWSGMDRITVGNWRDDRLGPMQVVSGPIGSGRIHFTAPDSKRVPGEMAAFIDWFNADQGLDPVLKAGIAHFWFITIHPFDDGNGRIARAIADMQLARADQSRQRFYSMSARIRVERNAYYDILEQSQRGSLDLTGWLLWFFNCLQHALSASDQILSVVLWKAQFWRMNAETELNERQRKMLNRLMDGFEGKLSSSKWAKMAKCSGDTALRDIQDLVAKDILRKEAAGGRSTNYEWKDGTPFTPLAP